MWPMENVHDFFGRLNKINGINMDAYKYYTLMPPEPAQMSTEMSVLPIWGLTMLPGTRLMHSSIYTINSELHFQWIYNEWTTCSR